MTKITVDDLVRTKLGGLREQLELCDEAGQTLGYFTPAGERSLYRKVQVPFTEEELDQIEQEGGGRTLTEILADLDARG